MAKKRRARWGAGQLYRPVGSRIWRMRYRDANGKRLSESLQTTDRSQAQAKMHRRMLEVGRQIDPGDEELTLAGMLDLVDRDYVRNGKRTVSHVRSRRQHLERVLGSGTPARRIRGPHLERYIAARQAAPENASNATVNRELALLRRAFRLALKGDRLHSMPTFTMLAENNVRQGWVTAEQMDQLLANLPSHLHNPVKFAALSAWRMRSEVLPLMWNQVDLQGNWVRWEPGTTKNRRGRNLALTNAMIAILLDQREKARALEARCGVAPSHVFFYEATSRNSKEGAPIRTYRAFWERARRAAGLPNILVHDLRRTGVMNMSKAGVPRSTAKQISGHLTDSIFERYNIADAAALQDAKKRMNRYDKRHGKSTALDLLLARGANANFLDMTDAEHEAFDQLTEEELSEWLEHQEGTTRR